MDFHETPWIFCSRTFSALEIVLEQKKIRNGNLVDPPGIAYRSITVRPNGIGGTDPRWNCPADPSAIVPVVGGFGRCVLERKNNRNENAMETTRVHRH